MDQNILRPGDRILTINGETHIEKGEYQQALDSYQKCLAIEIKKPDREHIDLASTHEKISNTYSFINDFEKEVSRAIERKH